MVCDMRKAPKPSEERAVRTTVSLSPKIWAAGLELVRRGGYTGISDYLQDRIRHDAGLSIDRLTHSVGSA